MNYRESLKYLDSLTKFGIKFGLERITALSEALGSPHKQLKAVHVGGTNGKGSTCTFISSILRCAGYRVGTYLSPYVFNPRERIQVDGEMIREEDFAEVLTRVRDAAVAIGESALGDITEFEAKTMAAFLHFARCDLDIAVLEVGMGGRYDATNIITPLTSVITNVSLDHTDRLGDTVEKIAREKAEIIKPGCTAITGTMDPDALGVIKEKCRQVQAELVRVVPQDTCANEFCPDSVIYSTDENGLCVRGDKWKLDNLHPSLAGSFQHTNAAVAAAAGKSLAGRGFNISDDAFAEGVGQAYIPGRLQVVGKDPLVVLDGAHNRDAAKHLSQTLRENFTFKDLILVVGMLETHSPEDLLGYLAPMASKIIAARPGWFRARSAEDIAECASKYCTDVRVVPSVSEAVKQATLIANKDDLVLVTGSFYTVGEYSIDS